MNLERERETERPAGKTESKEPAYRNALEDWMADVGGYSVRVRPIDDNDVHALLGVVKELVEEHEPGAVEKFEQSVERVQKGREDGDEKNAASVEKIIQKGEAASKKVSEVDSSVKGLTEIVSFFYNSLNSGTMKSKTPEIFMLAPGSSAEKYIKFRHQVEMYGTELDPTATDTDPSSGGVNQIMVMSAENGEKLRQILEHFNHKTEEFENMPGFEARLGGLRLAFIYSEKFFNESEEKKDETEETK